MPQHNGDAGRRVSVTNESCFQSLRGVRLADLLGCPSRGLEVRSILVVVAHVFCHESPQMPFVEDDYVVKQVSSTTSNPALSDTVLPRTTKGNAGRLGSHLPYCRNHIGSEL
jgi:hypothetical protein